MNFPEEKLFSLFSVDGVPAVVIPLSIDFKIKTAY